MNRKSTKKALMMSALSLLLCISMLIGTTYAWFTDTVTSKNNIIKSGKLDVEMYWADGDEDPATATYEDASEGAIFDYELWEPGYVQARHIKVANVGNLALKYQMRILANGVVSKLADVIDVYYFAEATKLTRANLTESVKLGTLAEVLTNNVDLDVANENALSAKIAGSLEPKGSENDSKSVTIALKMQESAGNEYQDLAIGTDFTVQLLATQFTYEEDSFNNKYDDKADYDAQKIPSAMVSALSGDELIVSLSDTETLTLDSGYQFEPTETYEQSLKSEYANAHADFYVYADRDVKANSLALGGYYKFFCDNFNDGHWIALTAGDVDANTGVRLIADGMNNGVTDSGITIPYSAICQLGNDGTGFQCGIADLDGSNAGTTVTVELRLYQVKDKSESTNNSWNEETGEYITVGKITYTFPGTPRVEGVESFDELKAALANGEDEINIAGNIKLESGLNASDVTFIGVTDDAAIDFDGHNIAGSGMITYKNLDLTTKSLPQLPENGERYGWYGGIDYTGHSVANYETCNISGVFTTYSSTVNLTECTFDYYVQDGEEFYNLFLYGEGTVNATGCTFKYGDRAIKAYAESAKAHVLNLTDCKFVADEDFTAINKALINVDTQYNNTLQLNIKGITIAAELATAEIHNAGGNPKVTVTIE